MIITYAPKRFMKACLIKDRQTEAVKLVKRFLSRRNSENGDIRKCLVLSGPPGTGKTHSLYAIMNSADPRRNILQRVFGKDRDGFFRQREVGIITPSFFVEIQYAKFDEKADVIDRVKDIDILCIDDMGMEAATEKNVELLEIILDHRYSHLFTTIITTNLPIEAFKERYTERVLVQRKLEFFSS